MCGCVVRPATRISSGDGALNRQAFETCLAKVLAPELRLGNIGIMNNVSSHKGHECRCRIAAPAGRTVATRRDPEPQPRVVVGAARVRLAEGDAHAPNSDHDVSPCRSWSLFDVGVLAGASASARAGPVRPGPGNRPASPARSGAANKNGTDTASHSGSDRPAASCGITCRDQADDRLSPHR